ncbi:MAG TPA: GNAT family N-acetyltransferase [Aliiroseovarius sp.]|nr:GNAT family N-acetyltransferase [Aliiroseovarius sp.]
MEPSVRIVTGLPAGLERDAAALYWEAFGAKLGRLLGPEARATDFFAATINPSRVVAALSADGTLLGIAAFKHGGQGFSHAGFRELYQHYGLSAFWRAIPLEMLERTPPEDTLQMDGICVAAHARGRGVGSMLFQALFTLVKEHGLSRITLDVIDTNPRAKALYERLGFQAVSEESTGPLRPLLGFKSATKMIRDV